MSLVNWSFNTVNMLAFRHPFTAIVSGPSQCGKSTFVLRLIRNASTMIEPPPQDINYCYSEYQSKFMEPGLESVDFHEGLPEISRLDGSRRTLLVIDDLMDEADESVSKIFTKISHHRDVSILFLTQNLFHKNKYMRTMSLNTHYMVLFKNPRDVTQFSALARQMYSTGWKFAVEAYRDATTSSSHGYLLIDLKPDTDERFRLRTNIFPGEQTFVYVKK